VTSERPTASMPPYQENVGRGEQQFKSPHEILAASGSMEAVRIRNVQNMLNDFFGLST
jgi:hypothetical protein